MSRRPRELHRVVGHDPHRPTLDAGEPDDHVGREQRCDLQEVAVVDQGLDDLVHVVGLVGAVRDDRVEEAVLVGHLERGEVVGR